MDMLNESFRKFGVFREELSVDEMLVRYFGHHPLKQFIRGKPIRFGYKMWSLCASDGYCYKFQLYCGKDTGPKQDLPLGTRVVTEMLEAVDIPTDHSVYFDNLFTSRQLMVTLAEEGYRATGTVQERRTNQCPLPDSKTMAKTARGTFETRFDTAEEITVKPRRHAGRPSMIWGWVTSTRIPPPLRLPAVVAVAAAVDPVPLGSAIPVSLKRAITVLEPVTKSCPGLLEALYLMAKAKYLSGDAKAAASTLKHCIDHVDQSYADAHLLNAQIQLHQGFFKQASQSLELGLSYNFEIKDHPLFHLIRARIQKREKQAQEAIQTLHTAIQLAGLTSRLVKGSTPKSKIDVNDNDKVSIYLELADAYRMANQEADAKQIMEEATLMFKGTGEEVRIIVANADLLLARNEVSAALGSLRNITPDQPYYLQSREKMAEIYFDYLKDRRMYAAMYKEIVDQIPTPASYLMLGDAYMTILEPDKAIEVYESALKRNPRDHDLALKMGRALVKTHHYGKAINYYKEAIKVGEDNNLRYDMAELQMRMRQYDKAEKTVVQAMEKIKGEDNSSLASLIMQAQLLKLLAKIHDLVGDVNKSIGTLKEANEVQVRVLKRVQMEQPDSVAEHKTRATEICCTMSERYQSQRNYEQAIKYYQEALQHQPDDANALLALARLYMQTGDLDQCQYTCMTLLRLDKENDLATVMMADLSFRRNDYETAMFHFQELLTRRPDYFAALARLVEVMRRTGHLEKVPDYLEKAEKASQRGTTEPGLAFCKALYEWYSSNPNGALKYFNQSRRDPEWGQRAIYHMINICLNPDNMTIGGETFEAMEDLADTDVKNSQEMALRTADKLLQLLTNFLLLASKNKGNMERALQEFTNIASSETYKDHVGAICGMATAYMLLKQTPRARNQLKRVAKNTWNFEDAEYLERCWLLLADIYIQSGKYDLAQDVIQRILQHNRSCGKAHEYAGFIHEKESSYKDAAENYEMSWRFSRHSNPVIGFKLAFNYLKAKRYVDAIDVCHQVMEKFPDYPKIRKDILDKARSQLKL
ncbi:Tetratricopeptide repeat protein 21B [Amphibalanus amphitrite]|uniref:Tetratricopeptide repeat protein 21B n=1 Tax=Amphibalanus amphitrite TaxID=1232801 RepID=A0A6A4W366_AMPAM|nr:Tetratricopeptide repeat protein 21B [Amphibalanus amphitrite]